MVLDGSTEVQVTPDPKKVEELVQRIVDAVHPLRIYLFGSAAQGKGKGDLPCRVVT